MTQSRYRTKKVLILSLTYKSWIGNSPDIGKTITNNILPSSLITYAVSIERYSHSVNRR